MKKIILAFLVIAMLFSSLISCGGAVDYKDDISVTTLSDSAIKKISLSLVGTMVKLQFKAQELGLLRT